MSEIAKCPICGKDPEVWCRDEEIRIRIVCCKHAAYSTPGWNQYAAAMELAKLIVERQKVNEEQMFTGPITEETFEKFRVLNRKSEEALWRVLEVFK